MENAIKGWEHINHLVNFYLNNIDGLEWKFEVGIKDEKDGTFRGMPIGFMTGEGFVSNPKDETVYRAVFTDRGVMFFRKKKGD